MNKVLSVGLDVHKESNVVATTLPAPTDFVGPLCFSSHLVTKRHCAALIAFDFGKMKGDISVEPLEEADPITDQNRQDGITHFVG
jgi:hypothetical protein